MTAAADPEPFYYDAFVDIYPEWAKAMTEDVPFYVEEALSVPGSYVELGFGTGRVGLEVARAGKDVIGVDKSEAMLAVAREAVKKLPPSAGQVTLCHADMRDFILPLREKARLIAIPFRSILHLLTLEDVEECLRHIHFSLAPGGKLVFNVFVPDPQITAERHNRPLLRSDYVDPSSGRRTILWELDLYEPVEQRLTIYAITEELDENDVAVRRKYRKLALRFMYPQETRYLLEKAGFRIAALYGWFDRRPFGPDSREAVWIAHKP